jgi:hypothetical protein
VPRKERKDQRVARREALARAAGRRGLFDIVRCVYAAPGFVTASVRGPAAILREQTADAGERAPSALRLTCCKPRLRPSPVSVLFSPVIGRQFGASPNGAGRARFPLSSRGLRGDHRRQVVPRLLFFSCILQKKQRHRGYMPFLPRLGPTATIYLLQRSMISMPLPSASHQRAWKPDSSISRAAFVRCSFR